MRISTRKSPIDSLGSGLGDLIWPAVAKHLDNMVAEKSILAPSSFKFVCEAIIATARADGPAAAALNRALAKSLFPARHRHLFLRNPRHCSMYALPLAFVRERPPDADEVARLFLRLHEVGAVRANCYPEYRNIEMDYVAARLSASYSFERRSLCDFALAFPWMSRDHRYGLTHVMFYNSDFGRHPQEYPPRDIAMVEALVAQAREERDLDLMLELIFCHATMIGADPQRQRHYAALAWMEVQAYLAAHHIGQDLALAPEHYHPLFVACLYSSVALPAEADEREAERQKQETRVISAFAQGNPIKALSAYSDFEAEFGRHLALDEIVTFYAPLLVEAAREVGAGQSG